MRLPIHKILVTDVIHIIPLAGRGIYLHS